MGRLLVTEIVGEDSREDRIHKFLFLRHVCLRVGNFREEEVVDLHPESPNNGRMKLRDFKMDPAIDNHSSPMRAFGGFTETLTKEHQRHWGHRGSIIQSGEGGGNLLSNVM